METKNARETERVPVHDANDVAEHGVSEEVVERLNHPFAEAVDGRNANVADGVRRALGRGPEDFRYYARGIATTGVWDGKR